MTGLPSLDNRYLIGCEMDRIVDSGLSVTHFLFIRYMPLTDKAKQSEARFYAEIEFIIHDRLFVMDTAAPTAPLRLNGPFTTSSAHIRWRTEGCAVYYTNSTMSTAILSQITKRISTGACVTALRHMGMTSEDVMMSAEIQQVLETGVLSTSPHGLSADSGNR